jgi:hypothetical protein
MSAVWKSVKSRAEEQFAAMHKKKAKKAVNDQEKAIEDRGKLTARLRALRLGQVAPDLDVATEKEVTATDTENATAKNKNTSQLN